MSEFLGSGVMDREDAIGYGSKGLIAAVDNFDASKGTSFASYAIMRIRGAIIDAAREMDILPRSQRRRMREVEGANMELANQLGRWPTVKELAMKTGLSIEEVKALQDQRWTCSPECSTRLRSPVQKEHRVDPPCVVCGNPVTRRRSISRAIPKTCSEECYHAALRARHIRARSQKAAV
jgi:RNA polymerase sigma factor (sigma-70 family)